MRGRPRTRSISLLFALALVLFIAGTQTAIGALSWTEKRVTTDPEYQSEAAIWGDKVVYTDDRNGSYDEIYLFDLSTGAEMRITTNDSVEKAEPDIYGDTIVWHGEDVYKDIYMFDLSTGVETRITDADATQRDPKVHGTRIVWADNRDGDNDIRQLDLVGGTEEPVIGDSGTQAWPNVFGENLVYEDFDTPSGNADIRLHDLVNGDTTRITDEEVDSKWDGREYVPSIWGDGIVWMDARNHGHAFWDIYHYDIASGTETRITDEAAQQTYAAIFRERVVWNDLRDNTNPYLHDLSDGMEYAVTDSAVYQGYPDVWGNKVVWEDQRDGPQIDIWMAEFELTPDRSGGATRYETAAKASANHFASAATVVVATGADFADALSAAGLAGCYGGPLILTTPGELSAAAWEEIERLGATGAVIVGGEGAVGPAVATALQGMGLTVERIGGTDRYDTASLIAARIEQMTGDRFEKTAFIARGDEFPDALAVSPLAYYNRFPILLTRPDVLPPVTSQALDSLDIEMGVVAGGTGAVSDGVKAGVDAQLAGNGGASSLRWAGPTRYETAVVVAASAAELFWAGRGFVGVAVGDNFPDALSGGAAAGREFGVLLLTRTDEPPAAAREFVADSGDGIGWIEAFGGSAVVSDAVIEKVVELAK